MCGIAGTASSSINKNTQVTVLQKWQTLLRHRGPDDWGHYCNPTETVLLFHARLSITGLSNGHQPLCNEDETVWLTFNGEIYQFESLREALIAQGHQFRTETDAEIIVHLYERDGLDCLKLLRGEFAFALYDTRKEMLFLVRDRFGIKPLFYAQNGGHFVFSSEIKGILAHPDMPRQFSASAIQHFLHAFYFADKTVFESIKQVPPACFVQFDCRQSEVKLQRYWQLPLGQEPLQMTEKEAVALFSETLETAVSIRLPKEVTVGAYLSGGLDSNAVVRLMTKLKRASFPVFTIGFQDPNYDELAQARHTAKELGLQHHTLVIDKGDLKDAFLRSIWHSEMPVLNTHGAAKLLLSALARQHCKVVLTGEGADETLLGYEAFAHLQALEKGVSQNTQSTKNPISKGALFANKLPYAADVKAVFGVYPYPMLRYFHLRRLGQWLLSNDFATDFKQYDWTKAARAHFPMEQFKGLSGQEATQLFLFQSDLPAYILNYLGDRPEMSNGLEGRTPFLDHHLVELACRLPENLKLRDGTGKYILREATRGLLDEETRLRPKNVFYAPSLSSLDFRQNADFFHDFVSRKKFKEVGIFSFNTFQSLKFVLRVLPTNHKFYPVIESAVVLVLSTHILHELFISNFEKYTDLFSKQV